MVVKLSQSYLPFPRLTTPNAPEPRKTAPLFEGMLAAAALTGTAGGGCRGIIAVPETKF